MLLARGVDGFMDLYSIVELVEVCDDEMHCVISKNATGKIPNNFPQSAGRGNWSMKLRILKLSGWHSSVRLNLEVISTGSFRRHY